jgi:DNA-binding HxlR family transcriptional regulator
MSKIKLKQRENILCPVEYTVSLLSGKWKLRILHALIKESPKRFKVLEREVTGITPTMLTSELRELEADGLVGRKIFATVPPTVEYSLTEFGKSTIPMMDGIKEWGLMHKSRNI